MLTLSPSHIEKYFNAAEAVVSIAVPEKVAPPAITRQNATKLAGGAKNRLVERSGQVRHLAFMGSARRIYSNGVNGNAVKVRVQVSALVPAGGAAPRLTFYADNQPQPIFDREILSPEGKPVARATGPRPKRNPPRRWRWEPGYFRRTLRGAFDLSADPVARATGQFPLALQAIDLRRITPSRGSTIR